MLIHEAVKELEELSFGMGTEDGDLMYQKRNGDTCPFCHGSCMACEFGGRVAEIASPEPFTARMRLENLYHAPLSSVKTRVAALGALNAVAGFLMITRKTGPCNSVFIDDCRGELADFCKDKTVRCIGGGIAGIPSVSSFNEADLVLVFSDALKDDTMMAEISSCISAKKNLMFVGANCLGIAAVLHQPVWCPYGK